MKTIGLKKASGFDAETTKIINVVDPTADQDAATKKYVDDAITSAGGYNDEAGDAVMGTIVHGATSGTARPSGFDVVTWIGSVEPSNATDNDIWVDTA